MKSTCLEGVSDNILRKSEHFRVVSAEGLSTQTTKAFSVDNGSSRLSAHCIKPAVQTHLIEVLHALMNLAFVCVRVRLEQFVLYKLFMKKYLLNLCVYSTCKTFFGKIVYIISLK